MCYTFCLFITESTWWSGLSLVISIEYLITITCRACFWAAHKWLSISRLVSPRFNHSHLFLSSVLSASLKNWLWRAFSFYSFYGYIRKVYFSYIGCLLCDIVSTFRFFGNYLFQLLNNDFKTFCRNSVFRP